MHHPAIFSCLALLLAGCASVPGEQPSGDVPPNIILIMADDLGYGELGSYGQTKIQTLNLDRIAQEGMRFTQFYAGSTVCAPSRSVLMTGQHTGHTPIRGNREVEPIGQEALPASALTMAEVLKEAGYATGAFGKWGLGAPGSEGVPTKQGFDAFFGYLGQRRAHFYYPTFLFRREERVPLEGNEVTDDPQRHPGSGPAHRATTYSHDVIAEEALRFIEKHRDDPFFLYMPSTIPHVSIEVPDDALDPYLDDDGRSIFPETPYAGGHYSPQERPHAAYAAMVTRLDREVGRIVAKLDELGLSERTIVIFTSDNGPSSEGGADPEFFDSNGPLRGGKRDLYDGGIRVPMIAWGPGRVPAGSVSDAVWAMWDVLPTVADLAGIEAPQGIDGVSMRDVMIGGTAPRAHEYLYWEFYERGSAQAVRAGRWKAVRIPMLTGDVELFDIENDIGETTDLAAEHPDVVREMIRTMEAAHTPSEIWQAPSQERSWMFGPFERPDGVNPILEPSPDGLFEDPMSGEVVSWEEMATFNPAAVVRDGKIYVLYRAEDMLGEMTIGGHTSRIGIAESTDGLHFRRRAEPVLYPADDDQKANEWPGGVEDPRIVEKEDGTYVMTYTQWNRKLPQLAVATSPDLVHWEKHGPIFPDLGRQSKSGAILTRVDGDRLVATKVNGTYWMYWGVPEVNLATSPDLIHWELLRDDAGELVRALSPRPGKFDAWLVEAGPPPVLTDDGIVVIYNAGNSGETGDPSLPDRIYTGGQALFAADDPTKLLDRSETPFIKPELPYERSGQYEAGTTFLEGLVPFDGKWFLFYGTADSRVAVAVWDPR